MQEYEDSFVRVGYVYVLPKAEPRVFNTVNRTSPTRDLGFQAIVQRGWSHEQWVCLEKLWTKESNWRPEAQNRHSTAYGIAQFLNSTWAGTGIEKTSDPELQIEAGLRYIEGRYKSACNALNFHHTNNYY